jgi:hypothetical protein
MWYFDAWAVKDGLAFVSERTPDNITSESTVFLSVPDLEPVPLGRISTALRATRANFQDGFRDANGEEFGFDNLAQVREVIRRAYLASGLGPVGAAEVPIPQDPFLRDYERPPFILEPPSDSGGAYYERRVTELLDKGQAKDWQDCSSLQYPEPRFQFLKKLHETGAARELYPYVRAFAEATLIECARRFARNFHLPSERQLLRRWVGLLGTLGLWDGWEDLRYFLETSGIGSFVYLMLEPYHFYERYAAYPAWEWREVSTDFRGQKQLLFRIPCPLRSTWHQKIRVLSDKLLLPLTDREYFSVNKHLPEFVPLLLCSMVVTADPSISSGVREMLPLDRHRIVGRAFRWLSHELPIVELPSDVEEQLSTYAWDRLG